MEDALKKIQILMDGLNRNYMEMDDLLKLTEIDFIIEDTLKRFSN